MQGDVSNDLAEDAFFQYLKKLKELAKLDIVTMYCEEKPDPSLNTLHVIGRTSNTPHKYFYRRYAHQMWTPWEPVTAEIDGDHIVAVVWRERLHLFWVTFMVKPPQDATTPTQVDPNASVGTIFNTAVQRTPQLEVQVQLHWSEYFQGQWSTRESSGSDNPLSVTVGNSFDSRNVFIHVTKEYDNEEESVVKINLLSKINGAFHVVSKNSPPEPKLNNDSWGSLFTVLAIISPYIIPSVGLQATHVTGSGSLSVNFREKITTQDEKPPEESRADKAILQQGNEFSLLRCSNLIDYYPDEFKPIVSPIFYQDGLHNFFIEPSLTETTIDRWEEWIITTPPPVFELDDDWWKSIPIVPIVPIPKQPVPIAPIDPRARFGIQPKGDWLTNPATVLEFGDRVVGQVGGFNPALVTGGIALSDFGVSSSVHPGGTPTPGNVTVTPGMSGLAAGAVAHGGLNVIGGSGLSSVTVSNMGALTESGLGRNLSGIGSVGGILNR